MSEDLDVNKIASEFVSSNIERFYNLATCGLPSAIAYNETVRAVFT
jgi:hypothetical protein